MKVKIYLGEEIVDLTPVAISTLWRYRLSFRDNPADSTSFNFDIVKNGEIHSNIRKTFTTATTYDETYSLLGVTADDTIDNLLENLGIFNVEPDITYALSDEVGIDGFYDINIDVTALPTDTFSINISGNSTTVVAIYGPTLIDTVYQTGTTVTSYSLIDLYGDENIEFTSKLSDIEKLSNVFTDFSNSFTIPATSNNNELFKHYYDVDIDNTFNANIRVNGYLEIDSFPLRFGKIQLESVTLKEQKPDSYKITFYGGLLQLSDLFADDTINKLDYDKEIVNNKEIFTKTRNSLSQFDYPYNSTNFINSINLPSFKDGNVITPLIAYTNRDWNYGTANSIDISTNDGAILDSELRPALRLMPIIEAIEDKYNISFTREFFGGATFNNLFIWLNQQTEGILGRREDVIISEAFSGTPDAGNVQLLDGYVYITRQKYSNINAVQYFARAEYSIYPVNMSVVYNAYLVDENGNIITEWLNLTGDNTLVKEWVSEFDAWADESITVTEQFKLIIESSQTLEFTANLCMSYRQKAASITTYYTNICSIDNSNIIYVAVFIEDNLPKMKVIDFLQGLMKMFKLIIRPVNNNVFYINTLDGYYSDGNLLDITDYVNQDSVTIERPSIYKIIKFNFQKTNNVLGKKFREINDPENDEIGYGDIKSVYARITEKNELKVELPFENMLFERLTVALPSTNAGDSTNWLIGQSISTSDEITFKKNNSKPILFFNNGITNNVDYPIKLKFADTIGTITYGYLLGNTNDEILSQVTDTINWGAEIDPWHGQIVANSLYLNYWSNWINTIYDLKQRKFTFEANLPPRYIEELSLNDRLIIGNQRYKINDYKINLLNGNTKLTLFKDIYEWNEYSFPLDINEPFMTVDRTEFSCNAGKKYYSINLNTNLEWYITKTDDGFGTDWIDVLTPSGNGSSEIVFIVNQKASQTPPEVYDSRTMILTITNDDWGTIDIFINQFGLLE
jgi:hypothetical protein